MRITARSALVLLCAVLSACVGGQSGADGLVSPPDCGVAGSSEQSVDAALARATAKRLTKQLDALFDKLQTREYALSVAWSAPISHDSLVYWTLVEMSDAWVVPASLDCKERAGASVRFRLRTLDGMLDHEFLGSVRGTGELLELDAQLAPLEFAGTALAEALRTHGAGGVAADARLRVQLSISGDGFGNSGPFGSLTSTTVDDGGVTSLAEIVRR